ncbi:MAG: radical SAM protein [Bryobacteraceae bacterium]|nr:radical SAM protein [Bryobacteraceae bacterium]
MRAFNRWRLLLAYLRRRDAVEALPVEYIVETTAKCNIYCPMCPRETHKQPKEDMTDDVFRTLVAEAGQTAEHMMLIGLGEPLLDPRIYDRIELCHQHSISSLISTNGTLLDEKASERMLSTHLEHITLSFDGARKETFEFYRKGASFERVRDNFVRFCRMKHERGRRPQIVVQLVRMDGNAAEVDDFIRFWRSVPGVDLIRIKEDETNLMRPDSGHAASDWKYPCHYLWRGAMYVKHSGDVYPCCQSYMLDGSPVGRIGETPLTGIFNGPAMREMRRLHAAGRAGEIGICARCCTTIPHPLLVAGSLVFHGRTVRSLLPWVERLIYLAKLPARWLTPPKPPTPPSDTGLIQINGRGEGAA